jgi:hypothetical protein
VLAKTAIGCWRKCGGELVAALRNQSQGKALLSDQHLPVDGT